MIFDFIGWCKEGVHDKVWGVIDLGDALKGQRLTFWGRRGKKLSTNLAFYDRALCKLIDDKQDKKNYKEIDPAWCKRTNGHRLTVLDLWRTLPIDKFADVADVLYLGSGR